MFDNIYPIRKRPYSVFHAKSQHFDKNGNLLWEEPDWVHNILHDEGEQYILACAFDTDLGAGFTPSTFPTANSQPANYLYMGLDNRTTLAENDTLATVTVVPGSGGEPNTGNYTRQPISIVTGFTITQPGAYYQAAQAAPSSFTASGASMGTARNRFLCNAISGTPTNGRLIASLPLSQVRTINDGDTLNTNLIIGLSE